MGGALSPNRKGTPLSWPGKDLPTAQYIGSPISVSYLANGLQRRILPSRQGVHFPQLSWTKKGQKIFHHSKKVVAVVDDHDVAGAEGTALKARRLQYPWAYPADCC